MTYRRSFALLFGIVVTNCCQSPERVEAAPYVFTIDANRSSLTVSGTAHVAGLGPYVLSQQAPGSLTSSLSGTVNVDTDFTSTLSLSGGSSIVPAISGSWAPASGGAVGAQLAQYGVLVNAGFGSGVDYATTNTVFDLSSGPLTLSPDPLMLAGNLFDSSQVIVTLLTTSVDFHAFGLISGAGSSVITGVPAPNQAGVATLTVAGNIATLDIPITATHALGVGNGTVDATVSGQIVATAMVPEPSTIVLMIFGASMLVSRISTNASLLRLTALRQATSHE